MLECLAGHMSIITFLMDIMAIIKFKSLPNIKRKLHSLVHLKLLLIGACPLAYALLL